MIGQDGGKADLRSHPFRTETPDLKESDIGTQSVIAGARLSQQWGPINIHVVALLQNGHPLATLGALQASVIRQPMNHGLA